MLNDDDGVDIHQFQNLFRMAALYADVHTNSLYDDYNDDNNEVRNNLISKKLILSEKTWRPLIFLECFS
ncbi:MAG: hypothetical protein ABUT20_02810 [Bacteroidota bacterium]